LLLRSPALEEAERWIASRPRKNQWIGRDVAYWPLASFRIHALNDRSWRNNGHRAAQARNPSVAFDPNATCLNTRMRWRYRRP
jgi:hypothetical protein